MQITHQTLLLLILTAEVLCCRQTSVPNSAGCSGRELQAACAGLANHNRPVAATAHLYVPQLHTCLGQVSLSAHLCCLCFWHFMQAPSALAMAASWTCFVGNSGIKQISSVAIPCLCLLLSRKLLVQGMQMMAVCVM